MLSPNPLFTRPALTLSWKQMKPVYCLFLITCFLLALAPHAAYAKPHQQITSVRSAVLQGELPYQYTAHFFGVEVNLRDGVVALTLAYEPQNNPNLRGFVNFMVLDEDGMRRFMAGSNPRDVELASGAPLQFDDVGNKTGASFQAVGRGKYTVIVFNNAQLPVRYTLIAEGATLVDNANQSRDFDALDSAQEELADDVVEIQPSPLGSAGGNQLSGALDNTIGRHYLQVVPDVRDGSLIFYFRYDPLDQPALHGNVNFWILDEEGLNAIIRGDKAGDVNLATGFPIPFSPFPNELQASFNASGRKPYTAVIYNRTKIPATYTMVVDGGQLVDRYGQTEEAKANLATTAETQANGTNQNITLVTARSNIKPTTESALTPVESTTGGQLETNDNLILDNRALDNSAADSALLYGVPQIAGSFNQAYQHHYFALTPKVRDGKITLSLAFDPKKNQELRENINFLVLTEEGLRSVLAGGPPVNYDIATGSFGLFGSNQDKLFASFQTSGRGEYTVIVYNNSSVPARYILSAEGGLLATGDVERSLP